VSACRSFVRAGLGVACLAALAWAGAPGRARAVEFLDGRLQIHGYGEMQLRSLANDYDAGDDFDLAQWWNVVSLEIEYDIAPDGFGPIDSLSAYARIEARYDCVWRRGCGMLSAVDSWGDRAIHLPNRLSNAKNGGYTGTLFTGDTRRKLGVPIDRLGFDYAQEPFGDRHTLGRLWHVPGIDTLFGVAGPDAVTGTSDDPAFYVFEHFIEPGETYKFALRKVKGSENGVGTQVLGPWSPENDVENLAVLRDRANPFNPTDVNPVTKTAGSNALPFRPAPLFDFDEVEPLTEARGLYYPNRDLARLIRNGVFDSFDQNFRQRELEWNRGASQQDEKELKELYFDVELFDSRLWLRIGRQNIVWGKTELFRTTDQFNPTDLALASLPSLEESRIALWAVRGVWSFYAVGPLDDVRLELAANFDQVEPTDLGRCGEPYTPNPVCDKTAGLFAHSITGAGLAGEIRPPNPWNSWKGLEVGARIEFRAGRFSFQISDFYGYDDYPYVKPFFSYERNVDPVSGRPRRAEARGECLYGTEADCLQGGEDALRNTSVNQTIFALICASSFGFSALDRGSCAQSVLNSQAEPNPAAPGYTVANAVGSLLAGSVIGRTQVWPALTLSTTPGQRPITPFLVQLNQDPSDGPSPITGNALVDLLLLGGVSRLLTDQQEGLLGCGPFYATNCDLQGVDLLNAEATAVIQSWPGVEGTEFPWSTTDATIAQPGTVGFEGGPLCTRYEDGRTWVLPGCRGPQDEGWDINVDGSVRRDGFGAGVGDNDLRHPFTGQFFRSEMAALSWNALLSFVALSLPPDVNGDGLDDRTANTTEFDRNAPFRQNGCSFARPEFCGNVSAIYSVVGVQRNSVLAGGNGHFGRRDFSWHGGAAAVLKYEKRNVLGFSLDFAEDVTKSNWGMEATWIKGQQYTDNGDFDGLEKVDEYNLTISVDRPTFVNFLNQNRTLFFNSQWFFQYLKGWDRSFPGNGPWNVLATFTVQTGYFQDRLLPGITFVYDFKSNSGALLPEVQYLFTANFSVAFGMAGFWGHFQRRAAPLTVLGPIGNRAGRDAYRSFAENGLSPVRDRDEIYLRIRYTF
jgi:hypothetical protein